MNFVLKMKMKTKNKTKVIIKQIVRLCVSFVFINNN